MDIESILLRRRRQYLVHSYLYYRCDITLISDAQYDEWTNEMIQIQREHPDIASTLPYHNICAAVTHASGYHVRKYPLEIVTVAFHLLADSTGEPFADVCSRYGYNVEVR